MDTARALTPLNVVRSGLCIGCGSCVARSGTGEMRLDRYGQFRPENVAAVDLSQTCPFSPVARNEDELALDLYPEASAHETVGRFRSAFVGAVTEDEFRKNGSSGGMVSWTIAELLRQGLIDGVAHVAPVDPSGDGRFVQYRISRTVKEVAQGAKSRYYPVEMSRILDEIRSNPGRYAVVGVPCFIKAIQLLRREDPVLRERIAFTLGLFCGHMKSARFVESFALQMGVPLDQVQAVEFRVKDETRPASTYTAQLTLKDGTEVRRDWWNLVDGDWGSGFFQYSACNYCDDVIAETADISFGDAWVEPYSSDGRGTNVIVVRSSLVESLVLNAIDEGRLEMKAVDAEFIVQTQAAGFRQRREGLAYRLTWPKKGIRPRKRVAPSNSEPLKRKLIYRMRAHISAWSHRTFWLARSMRRPTIYTSWGSGVVAIYHGLTYSRGKWGKFFERIGMR